MNIFTEFADALEKVAATGSKLEKLAETTQLSEAAALGDIITKVRPVMRYIDIPIETSYYFSGHQMHSAEHNYFDERGIILVDEYSRTYTDRDYRGKYTGDMLILTRSGKLVKFTRSGFWSNWQNEECYYSTDQDEITPDRAVAHYGLAGIVSGMVEAFKKAIAGAEKKQVTLGSRLEALEKVKGLL